MPDGSCLACKSVVVGGGLQCERCRSRVSGSGNGNPDSGSRTRSPDEAHVSEAERQEELRLALLAAGWRVWRVGQRRPEGTQDAGVSDLICLRHGSGVLFVEAKRPDGGVLSRAQLEFREACAEAGVPWVCASQLDEIRPYLARPPIHARSP